MEKFGCKFSELKDPQDRMSVGGTIGGRTTGPQQAVRACGTVFGDGLLPC